MSAHTGSTSITTTEVLYKPAKTDSIVTSARNYLVGSAYQIFQNGQGISTTCALKYYSCAVIIDRVKNFNSSVENIFLCSFLRSSLSHLSSPSASPAPLPRFPWPLPHWPSPLPPTARSRMWLSRPRPAPPGQRPSATPSTSPTSTSSTSRSARTSPPRKSSQLASRHLLITIHMMCILKIIFQLTF